MTEETLQRAGEIITGYQRCPVLGRPKSPFTCYVKILSPPMEKLQLHNNIQKPILTKRHPYSWTAVFCHLIAYIMQLFFLSPFLRII